MKKSTKKTSNQQETDVKGDSTAQQGLAVLKNLIAKAAAGTLGSKSSSTTKINSTDEPKMTPSEPKVMTQPSLHVETSTKCSMEVQTETLFEVTGTKTGKDEAIGQESDYWLEEKLKMQNAPAYQSFQKGAQMKKSLTTSKGTSPPPQTISTQVQK